MRRKTRSVEGILLLIRYIVVLRALPQIIDGTLIEDNNDLIVSITWWCLHFGNFMTYQTLGLRSPEQNEIVEHRH